MADLPPPKAKEKAAGQAEERDPNTVDIEEVIAQAKPKEPTAQPAPDSIKPLQLKIPESKKNEFKAYSAMRGKSMNALFLEMFEEYIEKHA